MYFSSDGANCIPMRFKCSMTHQDIHYCFTFVFIRTQIMLDSCKKSHF